MMIRMVGRWVFLLVPAYPGSPRQRAVKRLLLLLLLLLLSLSLIIRFSSVSAVTAKSSAYNGSYATWANLPVCMTVVCLLIKKCHNVSVLKYSVHRSEFQTVLCICWVEGVFGVQGKAKYQTESQEKYQTALKNIKAISVPRDFCGMVLMECFSLFEMHFS